ncbi:sensor histidine kinase [Corallococcus sicarius]|uniref:histidine kinase n=1 Tax=Corallococcus sicarius TaxID=2316726 RepID=A0A3A8N7I3_9BACT|nr:ATP-binding protein [Corallococcus sicarius]RKH39469.1 PAS domain S-box protein [Corallococcus sicarius]
MRRPLRVLMVEDSEDDAELTLGELRRGGFEPSSLRVEAADTLREALGTQTFDVVISDFTMPAFTGLDALRVLKESGKDIPFILVSGSVGEDVAVTAMRAGAQDFFPKGNTTRLPAAVERELREAGVRRERRRMEMALAESQALQRQILESVRDYAIFSVDAENRIASWSPGCQQVQGYSAEEFIGLPFASLFTPEDIARGVPEATLQEARERGQSTGEGLRVRKDGTSFWAQTSLTPLHDPAGRLRGYTKITQDVSEKQRLIDELQAAVRARDEFLSIAGHELNTPLTSLQLQLQSLRRPAQQAVVDPQQAAKFSPKLEGALRQVSRLAELVTMLLDVSRLTSGRLELRREPLDLGVVAHEVIERLEGLRSSTASTLELRAPEPVTGQFDRLKVETILTNLLVNAFKFGEGRPVVVTLVRRGALARLTVQDGGIGIDAADQTRLFQRFERAVSDRHYGGFGIGLWLVRQFAEAHGGTIHLESAPGQGSTFTVELPLLDTAA